MKKIFANYIYLFILQVGNYIVPLVLMPFLVMKLGIYYFGLLSISLAINMFLRAVSSYGFDLTGVKEVRNHIGDDVKLSSSFCSIISAKLCIFLISALFIPLIVRFVSNNDVVYYLSLYYMLVILGEVLFPIWFYQGVQDMKVITILKLLSRFVFVCVCFIFVDSHHDIYIVPLSEGVCAIIIGVFSIWYAKHRYVILFKFPSVFSIKQQLLLSWDVFISKISVLFYTSFNTIVLSMVVSPNVVGFYAVSERIYMALRELINPLIQSIYPFMVDSYSKPEGHFNCYARRFLVLFFCVLLVLSFFVMFWGGEVLSLLTKENVEVSHKVLMILGLCIPFSLGGYFSTLLIITNKSNLLARATFFTMIVNTIIVFPLVYKLEAVGLAICTLVIQVFHFGLQIYFNKDIFKR
ncbi:oligosaccharide flippase family protein [Aeromonas salmonicida subsp. pectinolytica]